MRKSHYAGRLGKRCLQIWRTWAWVLGGGAAVMGLALGCSGEGFEESEALFEEEQIGSTEQAMQAEPVRGLPLPHNSLDGLQTVTTPLSS